MGNYILNGHEPVEVHDIMVWAEAMNGDRRVEQTHIGDILISTVFLGIDHSHGSGPPILFETMIFGGKHEGYQERYATWDEAVEGHKRACELVKQ
jgi:hypothetical protein